jgi:hypothetical protein
MFSCKHARPGHPASDRRSRNHVMVHGDLRSTRHQKTAARVAAAYWAQRAQSRSARPPLSAAQRCASPPRRKCPVMRSPATSTTRRRNSALADAVRAFKKELGAQCAVGHTLLESMTLIVRYSQSKLSQQELADLQKATHFDKKELQQWYKGVHSSSSKDRWSYC